MFIPVSLPVFFDRVVHGLDVPRRDVGHDVVDLGEDEPAAGSESLYALPHVAVDLIRAAERKDSLRVAAAAPERQVLPELALESRRSMPRALVWTGLMISTPTSMRSGRISTIDPQE